MRPAPVARGIADTGKLFRLIIATAFSAVLTGCIAFPVPPPDQPTFDEDALPFTAGMSTRDDVAKAMSETRFSHVLHRFGDDSAWVYHSRTTGWGFFIGGISYTGAGADYAENARNNYLTIRFDDADVVSAVSVDTLHWGCEESGLCRKSLTGGVEGEIMMLADTQADGEAKLFTPPRTGCSVYLYAEKYYFSGNFPVQVVIDGAHLGWFTNNQAYYEYQLDAGMHTIVARNVNGHRFTMSKNCSDGEIHFLRVPKKGPRPDFIVDSSDVGVEQVRKRQLALATAPGEPTVYVPSPTNSEPQQ